MANEALFPINTPRYKDWIKHTIRIVDCITCIRPHRVLSVEPKSAKRCIEPQCCRTYNATSSWEVRSVLQVKIKRERPARCKLRIPRIRVLCNKNQHLT